MRAQRACPACVPSMRAQRPCSECLPSTRRYRRPHGVHDHAKLRQVHQRGQGASGCDPCNLRKTPLRRFLRLTACRLRLAACACFFLLSPYSILRTPYSLLRTPLSLLRTPYSSRRCYVQVLRGDPYDLSNPLLRAGRSSSFDPFDDESSRIVAAAAAVHALTHPSAVELTISAASGETPPTQAEWSELFENV